MEVPQGHALAADGGAGDCTAEPCSSRGICGVGRRQCSGLRCLQTAQVCAPREWSLLCVISNNVTMYSFPLPLSPCLCTTQHCHDRPFLSHCRGAAFTILISPDPTSITPPTPFYLPTLFLPLGRQSAASWLRCWPGHWMRQTHPPVCRKKR